MYTLHLCGAQNVWQAGEDGLQDVLGETRHQLANGFNNLPSNAVGYLACSGTVNNKIKCLIQSR